MDPFPNNSMLKNIHTIKQLIKPPNNINKKYGVHEESLLHYVSYNNWLTTVKYLIESGADIDIQDKYNYTPLYDVTFCNNINIVKYLVDQGANLNICDNSGFTPLHMAAVNGNMDIVKCLLEHGADKYIKNDEGQTAADVAGLYHQDAIAGYIRDHDKMDEFDGVDYGFVDGKIRINIEL